MGHGHNKRGRRRSFEKCYNFINGHNLQIAILKALKHKNIKQISKGVLLAVITRNKSLNKPW